MFGDNVMKTGSCFFSLFFTATLLIFPLEAVSAEGDCDFCKKDHKKVCSDECNATDKSEGCMKKCYQSKCQPSCGEGKKEKGENKKNKADKKDKDVKKEGKKEDKKDAKGDQATSQKEGKKNGNKEKGKEKNKE